jgi:hypothetical protein
MGNLVDILPPVGFDQDNDEFRMINGTGVALAIGDILQVDTSSGSLDAVSKLFTKVRVPDTTAALTAAATFCVCMEAIPIGGTGRFRVEGDALCSEDNSAIVVGSPLCVTLNAKTLHLATIATANFSKVVGIAKAANSSTAGVFNVQFSGFRGFGHSGV